MTPFDSRVCSLGEGPLWHPERGQLFWVDINGHQLHTRTAKGPLSWQFDSYISAAGWVSRDELLIATASALVLFNLETGGSTEVCALEADNPITRANDGRADPYGGFWIGTMGINLEPGAGAIYRYYKGELRKLFSPWTVPNAQCFTPDGGHAYLTDTPNGDLLRVALDKDGWPIGAPELVVHLPADRYRPDGAVVDTEGRIWIAHYGHNAVTVHDANGTELARHALPARSPTCPAFGGDRLSTLYVTSAAQELRQPTEADGCTFTLEVDATGQAEHRVIL